MVSFNLRGLPYNYSLYILVHARKVLHRLQIGEVSRRGTSWSNSLWALVIVVTGPILNKLIS